MHPAVLTESLTKAYGRRLGIADLHLEVQPGEVLGFIGPNGAGKTTTIRLLLGLLRPTSGRASVAGFDVQTHGLEARRLLGYLPGEFGLDPRMTARGLITHFARLRGMDDLGVAPMLADRLGLDMDLPMGRLSRGNRQKAGLIQALYHRPPILILDEPTTGLDPLMQDVFLQIIREARDEGRTVFLSSHVLSEVERVCDRVAIVREGRLVAMETTASLLEKRRPWVTLVFTEPVDPTPFENLPGAADVRAWQNTITLRLGDGVDALVKTAARYTLVDLRIEHPSLDEVFLGYYGQGPMPMAPPGHPWQPWPAQGPAPTTEAPQQPRPPTEPRGEAR